MTLNSTSCPSPIQTTPAMTKQRPGRLSTPSLVTTNGNQVNNSATAPPYSVEEKPLGATKHVKIIGIGAGASGINMIKTLRESLTDYEFIIYEKNDDVGGTWHENRYPGCRCDIPSHNYQFSWRPNLEWSNFHAPAEEIRQYLCRICDEENMLDSIKLGHQVTGAWWNEAGGLWDVNIKDLSSGEEFHDQAQFIVDGSGILNNWKWPDVPDLHAFQGELIHTTRWPKGFEYAGKTVAVIGNGATGVQIVPSIQADVKKLYHFIRTPTWVTPPRTMSIKMLGSPAQEILSQIEFDDKENFSAAQIEKFKSDPVLYKKFVKAIEKDIGGAFALILNGSPIQTMARQKVTQYMTAMLGGDEKLCKALIPTFPLGTRRLTPAPGYLESLRAPHVEVITEGIARFVPQGIQLQSGEIVELDAIICATGFDTSFCPRFPIYGRYGNVQDRMRSETPKAYMSSALPGVPNYFTFLGPNAPIGHGSVFTLSEHIARYITGIIRKCQKETIRSIAPSEAAVNDYSEHIAAFMPRTSWGTAGRSWWKGGQEEGPVTALHPGSRIHFFHMLEHFRGEDWDYTYDSQSRNRFSYLGNGFSAKELDPSFDSTWYLDL
ncbi:hypothetical protein G7054_g4467 [Neopestalotiopsis clavispora]|nr:hypothetical protein G7054_g4467 [Neopestalotiopsis clavispora]